MKVPDCFCEHEAMQECKWTLETVLSYRHEDRPEVFNVHVPISISNVPQVFAQVALQLSLAALNEMHAKLTVEWQRLCAEGVPEEEMATRLMAMVTGDEA